MTQITQKQRQEILDFGEVKTGEVVNGLGQIMSRTVHINGERVRRNFIQEDRLFVALEFVQNAQYRINQGDDISDGYYNELKLVKELMEK